MNREQQYALIKSLQEKGHSIDEIDQMLTNLKELETQAQAQDKEDEKKEDDKKPVAPAGNQPTEEETAELAKTIRQQVMKELEPMIGYAQHQFNTQKSASEVLKAKAFKGIEVGKLNSKEKIGEYFYTLIKGAVTRDPEFYTHLKALSEGVDQDGGHLVPEYFRQEIIATIEQNTNWRSLATVIQMPGPTLELPKLTKRPEVFWEGENVTSSTTTAEFGNLVLTARKMISRMYTSSELAEDSVPSIVDLLIRLFAQAVSLEENRVFSNGNGTTQPKGILQETLSGLSALGNVTGDMLIELYEGLLPAAYQGTAAWQMSQRTWSKIMSLKNDQNDYLFKHPENVLLNGAEKRLMGRPVIINDEMGKHIVLGDFSYYYIGDRRRMSVVASTEADNTFARDQVQIKVTERVAGTTALTQAFRKITNAT